MRSFTRSVVIFLVVCVLCAPRVAAQTLVVNEMSVPTHVAPDGSTHVSLESFLRAVGFDWSLRGEELLLREGTGQGPRLQTARLEIKLGEEAFAVTGTLRDGRVYAPLFALLPNLPYDGAYDLEARRLTLTPITERAATPIRPAPREEEQAAARVRLRTPRQAAATDRAVVVPAESPVAVPSVPPMHAITLRVEDIPHPDVPPQWTTSRVIHGPQALTFKWRTHEPAAATGRYRIEVPFCLIWGAGAYWTPDGQFKISTSGSCGRLTIAGGLVEAPAPGEEAHFTIDFGPFLPSKGSQWHFIEVDAYPLARRGASPKPLATTSTALVIYEPPTTAPTFPDDVP